MVASNLVRSLQGMEALNTEAMTGWTPAQKQRFHDAIDNFIERLKKFC